MWALLASTAGSASLEQLDAATVICFSCCCRCWQQTSQIARGRRSGSGKKDFVSAHRKRWPTKSSVTHISWFYLWLIVERSWILKLEYLVSYSLSAYAVSPPNITEYCFFAFNKNVLRTLDHVNISQQENQNSEESCWSLICSLPFYD